MILINASPQDELKIFQPFNRPTLPVGVGCLMAVLDAEGITCQSIDEQITRKTIRRARNYVKGMDKPYIFGFSVLTKAFKRAIDISKQLKEIYPDSFILFGGIHPSALPEESLAFPQVDAVFKGEAENSIVKLYNSVKQGKPLDGIDGLFWKKNGEIVRNPSAKPVMDLDALPPFPYHLFESERYDNGIVLTSRGCPYNCIFCSNRITTGKQYRYKSAKSIVDDFELLLTRYNRRSIFIADDNFLVNKRRVYELTGMIKERQLDKKMTFSFQARGDSADYDIYKELFSAGFVNMSLGFETASERLMKVINKGETVEACIDAVKLAEKIGFNVHTTFIYGLPTETHEDRMKCVYLSKMLKLNVVRYNNATPYPGTKLFETAEQERRLAIQGLYENFISVSAFVENPFKKIPFSYVPENNTEEDIRNDILFSFLVFYLNMDRLKHVFGKQDENWGSPFVVGDKLMALLKKLPAFFVLFAMLSSKFSLLLIKIFMKRTQISMGDLKLLFKSPPPRDTI